MLMCKDFALAQIAASLAHNYQPHIKQLCNDSYCIGKCVLLMFDVHPNTGGSERVKDLSSVVVCCYPSQNCQCQCIDFVVISQLCLILVQVIFHTMLALPYLMTRENIPIGLNSQYPSTVSDFLYIYLPPSLSFSTSNLGFLDILFGAALKEQWLNLWVLGFTHKPFQ